METPSPTRSQFDTFIRRYFLDHPHEAGETYWEHFLFTVKLGSRLLYSSAALFIHGLCPSMCTRTASRQIEYMYGVMKSRVPKDAPKEETDNGWYWYI